MKTISRLLMFLFAVSLLAVVAGLLTEKHLRASTSTTSTNTSTNNPVPVTVTNTPLPVQGNVGVSGSVGITGMPSVTVANTTAVPVQTAGPSAATHTGQFASNSVRLVWSLEGFFSAVSSDGTTSQVFSIPSQQALVITDVEWHGIGNTPGNDGELQLTVGNVFVFLSTATVSANTGIGRTEHLTGGLVVTAVPEVHALGDANVQEVMLQGYLVRNQ